MSAHTPGRWEVAGQYVRTPLDASGGGWMIADCRDGSLPSDEVAANVRLIAAAPELLEALTVARGWHQGDNWRASEVPAQAAKWQEQMDRIDAAIAKATGASA